MQEITFYEQYEWSTARSAMKFWALVDGEPCLCWIDGQTLNAFAQSDNEDKNVQAYFMENQARIQAIAKQKILNSDFDEQGAVFITTEKASPGPE